MASLSLQGRIHSDFSFLPVIAGITGVTIRLYAINAVAVTPSALCLKF